MAPLYDVFLRDRASAEDLVMTAPMKTISAVFSLHGQAEARIQRECLSADKDFGCWLHLNQYVQQRMGFAHVLVRGVEARTEEHRAIEQERLNLARSLCPVPPERPTIFFVLGGLCNGNEGEPAVTTCERQMEDGWYYLLDDGEANGYGPHPSRDAAVEAAARHPHT